MNSKDKLSVFLGTFVSVLVTILLLWLFWPLLIILAAAALIFWLYMRHQAKKAEKEMRSYFSEEQNSTVQQEPGQRAFTDREENDIIDVEFTRKEPVSERMNHD